MTKSRVKVYITILLFAVFWLALFLLAIFPLNATIKKEALAYQASQLKLSRLINQDQEIARLNQEIVRLSQYQPVLENYFLKKDKALEFIQALENVARSTVGEFKIQIREGGASGGGGRELLYFQIDFESEFVNVTRFLAAVETMTYLAEIENLQMNRFETNQASAPNSPSAVKIRGVVIVRVLASN